MARFFFQNILGCVIIALAQVWIEKRAFQQLPSLSKTPNSLIHCVLLVFASALAVVHKEYKAELGAATYAGIGAGLCGSLTTFASWSACILGVPFQLSLVDAEVSCGVPPLIEYEALAILQGKYLDAIAVFLGMLGSTYCAHMFGKLLGHPRRWIRGKLKGRRVA
eukprot:4435585-Amphidinium_carterae.1